MGFRSAAAASPACLTSVTSKVVCLIVALPKATRGGSPFDQARVLGVGHKASRGVKAGVIVDLDEAEHAVRATIADAERMAGVELEEIFVSAACGRMRSRNFTAKARIEGACRHAPGRHQAPDCRPPPRRAARPYLDPHEPRRLPSRRHAGPRRSARHGGPTNWRWTLHAVTADEAPIRNLIHVVERCYLSVAGLVAAPYASALAVTGDEDPPLGRHRHRHRRRHYNSVDLR